MPPSRLLLGGISMASNFLPNSNYQLPDISSHTRSRFAGRLFRPINARYQYLEGSAIWPLAKCSRIRLISYNSGPSSVSDDINWPSCAHIHMGGGLLTTDMFPWFPLSGWNTAEGIHSVRARRQLARHAPTIPPPLALYAPMQPNPNALFMPSATSPWAPTKICHQKF